jgi:cytidine deaminase
MTPISSDKKTELIHEAMLALGNCYPKDSKRVYAAAVLAGDGHIYSASNYGSDTASLTLHAEQSALAHAAAHGQGVIHAVAVTSNEDLPKGEFTPPCHMCKQLLWESRRRSDVPLLIILSNNFGETKEIYIDELMPLPWPAK